MNSFKTASVSRLSDLAGFQALLANNGRLAKGDLSEMRTPFFGDSDPENVLKQLRSDISGTVFDELENSEFEKCGPFKRSPYKEYKGNVHAYFFSGTPKGDESELTSATNMVTRYLTKRIRSPKGLISLSEAYRSARKNTNLGLPYLTNKWEPNVISDYLGRASRIVEGTRVKVYPFTLFHRSQPKGRTSWKDRVVWGSDHAETFAGLTALKPLLSMLRDVQGFEAWTGMEAVELRAAQIFAAKRLYVSTDFSGFDSTVSPLMLTAVFDVIRNILPSSEKMLPTLFNYYTSGEIATPEGLLQGYHGLPSGVTLTNIVGTLVQLILLAITCDNINFSLEEVDFMFLGDDGVIAFRSQAEADVHYAVAEQYGFTINREKSSESEDSFSFLQRHFRRDLVNGNFCPAVYSGLRTLGRLIWTERGGFKLDDEVLRDSFVKYDSGFWVLIAYMKLENCKRHPKFREIVASVVRGDKYGLNPSLIGSRDKFISSIKGYDTSDATPRTGGIAAFDSVRVAIEIRAELGLS